MKTMENKTFIIPKEDVGKRLDKVLVCYLKDYTRSNIQRLIDEGSITLNSKVVKAHYFVEENDKIVVKLKENVESDITPENLNINIIYEDKDIAVIDKQQGLVVHPGNGNKDHTLVNAIMYHIHDLSGINGEIRPGIVHRIDKDTTGLIVVAKNDLAHNALAEQLKDHTMHRDYIALVLGKINENTGTIIAPIGRDKNNRIRMAVDLKNGKEAITHFEVKKRYERYTLVECHLETGRTHQIRVHMNYIGHPIMGDLIYGSHNKELHEGQLLHAYKLVLIHPSTKKEMTFTCPLPKDFQEVLDELDKID